MTDDDWTMAAMDDGSLVAELLIHLRRAAPPQNNNRKKLSPAPPLRWRVRQRRSRPMLQKPTPTSSPTTPLSWSGATSASAGGFEESTSTPAERSKGLDANENPTSKRSRKKKTLSELKEDEVLILKERRDLEKKLALLHVTVEMERAKNDRLKRLKVDCVSRSAKRVALPEPAEESANMVLSYDHLSSDLRISASSNPAKLNEAVMDQEKKFILPDLNLPIEE